MGCDPPKELVDYMLQLFNKVNSGVKIDMITINGDLVGHKISADFEAPSDVIATSY